MTQKEILEDCMLITNGVVGKFPDRNNNPTWTQIREGVIASIEELVVKASNDLAKQFNQWVLENKWRRYDNTMWQNETRCATTSELFDIYLDEKTKIEAA